MLAAGNVSVFKKEYLKDLRAEGHVNLAGVLWSEIWALASRILRPSDPRAFLLDPRAQISSAKKTMEKRIGSLTTAAS
jgi:hypothetical protein